uniref:NADH-ubiquinone oxidoreductase chain 1 n=1 Tax=Amblyseiulella paraheveae TaxID=3049516 RepID=A0AAU6PBQ7_9ACAR
MMDHSTRLLMIIYLIMLILILISIAFFTLLERKILSYIQLRKGPNKIFLFGLLQPLADGVKLFFKENKQSNNMNMILYNIFPCFLFFLMLMLWTMFIFLKYDLFIHSMIFMILLSSLSVYGILGSSWASNSKYSMLGAYRSVAQIISYEVGLIFMLMVAFIFIKNFNLSMMLEKNNLSHLLIFGAIHFFIIWFVILLAELNRAPFDFAESESELVSGFNIEYGSMKFALLFLSEYGNMIFMAYLTMIIFYKSNTLFMLIIMTLMIWVRGTYPRFRYDNLMYLNWKHFLPQILMLFILIYSFYHIIY